MSSAALHVPTFEELYAQIEGLREGLTGEILEPGVLRVMSRPGRPHRFAAMRILDALRGKNANLGGAGWWIEVEVEIRLGDRLVVPDLSGWRVERVPELPDENPITILPDWACEVLSPGTAAEDRRVKLPLYARAGVAWTWLVDPERGLVEVYESVRGRATLALVAGRDETIAVPPFDLPLSVGEWFLAASGRG